MARACGGNKNPAVVMVRLIRRRPAGFRVQGRLAMRQGTVQAAKDEATPRTHAAEAIALRGRVWRSVGDHLRLPRPELRAGFGDDPNCAESKSLWPEPFARD